MNNYKNKADKLLYDFGLLNELNRYGTPYIVGSYAMDLMAWNDLLWVGTLPFLFLHRSKYRQR